jgi:hypothetical protein
VLDNYELKIVAWELLSCPTPLYLNLISKSKLGLEVVYNFTPKLIYCPLESELMYSNEV